MTKLQSVEGATAQTSKLLSEQFVKACFEEISHIISTPEHSFMQCDGAIRPINVTTVMSLMRCHTPDGYTKSISCTAAVGGWRFYKMATRLIISSPACVVCMHAFHAIECDRVVMFRCVEIGAAGGAHIQTQGVEAVVLVWAVRGQWD